jgi:hypothetical protein
LRVYGEDEDRCDETARGVEADPRAAKTRAEDQGTRTVLKVAAKADSSNSSQVSFTQQFCWQFGQVVLDELTFGHVLTDDDSHCYPGMLKLRSDLAVDLEGSLFPNAQLRCLSGCSPFWSND